MPRENRIQRARFAVEGGTSGEPKACEMEKPLVGIVMGSASDLETMRNAATMLQEPQLSAALATGTVRAFAPAYNGIAAHFSTALYFAQADWAAKNGKTIRSFLDATYAAARATNGRRSDSSTKSDPGLVQPMIDVAAKYGYISRAFSAKDIFI